MVSRVSRGISCILGDFVGFLCIYTHIYTHLIYLCFPVNPTIPIFSLHSPSIPFSKLSSVLGLPSVLLVRWFGCSVFRVLICDVNGACLSLSDWVLSAVLS